MDSLTSPVSQEEFKEFHSVDRRLYTFLVKDLWRDSVESLRVMALYLWLERLGCHNIVKKILSLPVILINELADEAITCLSCIKTDRFRFENVDIPLLQSLVEKEISLKYLHDNRAGATQAIMKITKEVCMKAFNDIMQQAIEKHTDPSLSKNRTMFSGSVSVPFRPIPTSPISSSPIGSGPKIHMGQTWAHGSEMVPPDDRTIFVTFSKGYPVRQWELMEFITRNYGDCIESFHMQEVEPHEQALFARVVFCSSTIIERILNGMEKAKFTINGKHVWVRKFVPKRPKLMVQYQV